MFNIDRRLIYDIAFGNVPAIPYMRRGRGELFDEGLTMGTFVLGKQGSGKTTFLANHLLDCFKRHPNRAIFILDWSGSISNILLEMIAKEHWDIREKLLRRIVYDELGHPEVVVPLPEFSHLYGVPFDNQITRVQQNWEKLASFLVQGATLLGGVAYQGLAPGIFKVLTSIGEYPWDIWQITEFSRFIDQPKKYLPALFNKYEAKIPERTREMLLKRLVHVQGPESELRTYALTKILAAVESSYAFPRLGYSVPGWTPREAIRNGYLVLINGQRLIKQDDVQHYLFSQIFSLIMEEIALRDPSTGGYEPVKIVLDEVLTFQQNPGMSAELSKISPQYRSRKVELYVAAQGLWQFDETLKDAIWNLGNVVCFAVEHHEEAEMVAKQLLRYEPQMEKLPAKTDKQNPTTEPDHGQYKIYANWIQNFRERECIIRRYWKERQKDPWISHVRKTKELYQGVPEEPVSRMKERLLKERGKPISEVLQAINSRCLPKEEIRVDKV